MNGELTPSRHREGFTQDRRAGEQSGGHCGRRGVDSPWVRALVPSLYALLTTARPQPSQLDAYRDALERLNAAIAFKGSEGDSLETVRRLHTFRFYSSDIVFRLGWLKLGPRN